MNKLTKTYAVDADILRDVLQASKGTNYNEEELRGYIVEYAYKRQHGIPFRVEIDGYPDGGYDFIRDGKKYDIKATGCPRRWMADAGYTAWSLSTNKVHPNTTYILCRCSWKGMRDEETPYVQECYEIEYDELKEVFAEVKHNEPMWELMSINTRDYFSTEMKRSNRDCLVTTNRFLDQFIKGNAKMVFGYDDPEAGCESGIDTATYTEFRDRVTYDVCDTFDTFADKSLTESDRYDIESAIKYIRNPAVYFAEAQAVYDESEEEACG